MFAADLSWVEPGDAEKVGERRERKERERATPSLRGAPSMRSSGSSRDSVNSIVDDRDMWWTSSFKKAKTFKSSLKARPSTSRSVASESTQFSRKGSTTVSIPESHGIDARKAFRDPVLQPSWTYTSTISAKLPSGALLDPPMYEVPELEGDISSRYTGSSGESMSSHEWARSTNRPAKPNIIDEVHEVQQLSPGSFVTRTTSRNVEPADAADVIPILSTPIGKKKAYTVKIEGCLDLARLKLQDELAAKEELAALTPKEERVSPVETKPVGWRPPSSWEIHLVGDKSQEKPMPQTPALDGIAVAHNSLLEMTRFQRFIRRMESAGPRVILDRLKEEWHDPVDEESNEELLLEKQLWILTAFQLQSLGALKTTPKPHCNTGKILEVCGNLAEVFQISAMHSRHKVHYVTTEQQRHRPLPGNVSYLTVPQPAVVPYPWANATFTHIRASTLPSLVPSAKLPDLLRECYRLLAPGGMVEIRIMDAAPVRKTAGPKMRGWIEDRLTVNLERRFRCTKPCMLLPGWVEDAGFEMATHANEMQAMRLPCAFDPFMLDVDAELQCLVGRSLWKDIWGSFVNEEPDEAMWWWEDEEVVQECLERKTVFECGTIYAYKK